jgi:hypothetical protein
MSKQPKSKSLQTCKYHPDQRATLKCFECEQLICDQCVFEWSKFHFTENARVLLGGGAIQKDHWIKMNVCPHCFVRFYIASSKKERERFQGIRGYLSGKSSEFQKAKQTVNNWEQQMLSTGSKIQMLCKVCGKAWHSSKYGTCYECACKKKPELLENCKKDFEHPWCKREFRIYGDPREEYLRIPDNPSAVCVFFRCTESSKCKIRSTHDPSVHITYFTKHGDYSTPTAFVLIKPNKKYKEATEQILETLRNSDAVKEVYRISENEKYQSRGYTVMGVVRADTLKELKNFLYLNLKSSIANWVESNPDILIWPPS